MNKQEILNTYVERRNKLNPYQEPSGVEWEWAKRLDMNEFSIEINKFPYKKDLLYGILDYTGNLDDFFDKDKRFNRDCDNFARAWCVWAKNNGYSFQEYVVTTKENLFNDAHVIAVIWEKDKYYLCNYECYGPYASEQEGLKYMKQWDRYSKGFIYAKGISQ